MGLKGFWPPERERTLLGRFYLAGTISEGFNVVQPFQFVYLYLVMERPEWALIPFMAELSVTLLLEIPSGALADLWGRKRTVIAGNILGGVAWGMVPLAAALSGVDQLLAVGGCFLLGGVSQAFLSGAEEAWAVDNLAASQRPDLVPAYFARIYSFTAFGGVVAASIALLLLTAMQGERGTLDLLWYLMAAGLAGSSILLATIPEHRPTAEQGSAPPGEKILAGTRRLWRHPPLRLFFVAILVATFAGSVADEAFDIALVTRGMDARTLAPLAIFDNLVYMLAPLLGMRLVARFGPTPVLVCFLAVPAAAISLFFFHPGLVAVIALYLVLDFFDGIWDPVAEAHLHAMLPSEGRATAASVVNQAGSLVEMGGLAIFALVLGEHSDEMKEATPGIDSAFSWGGATLSEIPTGWFGLPLPDLVLVAFILSGLAAVPFLIWSRRLIKDKT